MSFFDTIKSEVLKYKNHTFLESILAASALVAAADGKIDSNEKQKLMGYMKRNEALSVFDSSEIIKVFNKYCDALDFDFNTGVGDCMDALSKIKGKPEAKITIRLCVAIGSADGDFDKHERAMVKKMCKELDLDSSDFDI